MGTLHGEGLGIEGGGTLGGHYMVEGWALKEEAAYGNTT